jgi:hypothetical protein
LTLQNTNHDRIEKKEEKENKTPAFCKTSHTINPLNGNGNDQKTSNLNFPKRTWSSEFRDETIPEKQQLLPIHEERATNTTPIPHHHLSPHHSTPNPLPQRHHNHLQPAKK